MEQKPVIGIPEHQDPCHGGDTGLLGDVARLLQELIRHLSVSVWRGGLKLEIFCSPYETESGEVGGGAGILSMFLSI
ncbi:hypothetical protein BSKO_13204 [Bryopsis sp. KO-2023]|nr:hypothetical protein BSKO_13204 [Bryopsis sp. KO-2023]